MIKFFRKIRQNLILEGKTGKYIKYAFGEIFLVVIGILFALQINTWNENRKKKVLENDYLAEIKQNLIEDTLSINHVLGFHLQKKDSIIQTLTLFEQANEGLPYFEAIIPKMEFLTEHKGFESVRTGFDNMVSSDKIGIIRNKKIRAAMSNYYSDYSYRNETQERALNVTRNFTDNITPKAMSKELISSFFGRDLGLKPASELKLHSDEKVISNLFIMLQTITSLKKELTDRKEDIKELIDQIEIEMATNND